MKATVSEIETDSASLPILLWSRQQFRKITGSADLQEDVLKTILEKAKRDQNLLGVLLFGSVAARTHTWKSDVDVFNIYKDYEPPSGLATYYVYGVEVNRFYATLDKAIENVKAVPYLLHMFFEAEVLYDRVGSVSPLVDEIKAYFAAHPELQEEWVSLKATHQVEKQSMSCDEKRTALMRTWDELENRYSGGARKRTFFYT